MSSMAERSGNVKTKVSVDSGSNNSFNPHKIPAREVIILLMRKLRFTEVTQMT